MSYCAQVSTSTGLQCRLPSSHIADGLPYHHNGAVRWATHERTTHEDGSMQSQALGPDPVSRSGCYCNDCVSGRVDHGGRGVACDEGTCDCDAPDPAPSPVTTDNTWFHPDEVTVVRDQAGNILAYGVEL